MSCSVPESIRTYPYLSVCGVEIELMIVDPASLYPVPLAKRLLDRADPASGGSGVGLSNELVQHVLEIKADPPAESPWKARREILDVWEHLVFLAETEGCRFLGTGMHPWFDPSADTRLWEWEGAEIYRWYHDMFDCYRHGWANLQSVHLNIPFQTDLEFSVLHAVIRALLPLLPGLCSSTPFIDGSVSGLLDTRLDTYGSNQKAYPDITGDIIPEPLFSESEYAAGVFSPLDSVISELKGTGNIESQWLNSRGAIARFDRGSIEIRLMDTQECLDADLAFAEVVFRTAVYLCRNRPELHAGLRGLPTGMLRNILDGGIAAGDASIVAEPQYLASLGYPGKQAGMREIWEYLYRLCEDGLPPEAGRMFELYLDRGCLAGAVLKACRGDYSRQRITEVYRTLSGCEHENRPFVP